MIKFFRRIRQQLIAENQVSKYLLYAGGEVLLVVIGILLALQINNWNEDSKNERLAYDYLNALEEEFEFNQSSLNQQILQNANNANSGLEILNYTDPDEPIINELRFDNLLDQQDELLTRLGQ